MAAIAAFNAEGLFLWGKRNDNGKWTNPGGHMEPGEEPLEAARRELEEETGLQGQDFQYLGRGLAGRDGSVLVYCYRCIAEGEIDTSDDPDEECEEWRWIEPDDIPEEISSNLHSPKNILLRLLGLQEGDVEEPMAKKADPHFVEQNPYSGTAIKIPKFGTATRKKYDQDYLTNLAYHFTGGDLKRLRPIQVPTNKNMGSNMAVNKSRLALYKRMLKAKDRLPPVVVRRNGIGFDLLDGNHRLEAARQSGHAVIHALEIIDPPLKKGLPGLALVGALATGGAIPAQKPPAANVIYQQQGMAATPWTHDSLHPDLWPIAHLESSWGQNQAHASNRKGDFHTAYGAVGFKPVTAHEEYLKSKSMQAKYPDLNSPENFLKTFKGDPKFYNLLASAHFARLKGRHGGPQQAAYAWRWGTGACAKATKEQIDNDAYVQKYTHMKLDQKTGQVIPDGPLTLAKWEPPTSYKKGHIREAGFLGHDGSIVGTGPIHDHGLLPQGFQVKAEGFIGHDNRFYTRDQAADLVNAQWGDNEAHTLGSEGMDLPEPPLTKSDDLLKAAPSQFSQAAFLHKPSGKIIPTGYRHDLDHPEIDMKAFHRDEYDDGFVDHQGKFFSRDQALAHIRTTQPKFIPSEIDETELHSDDLNMDDVPGAWDPYTRSFKKHDVNDPLEAMLAHDDPRERILALKSKLVTPYHLRRALQDEDPDVRAAAAKHPMMTSALVEEALRHPDIHTREAALSRPDLQEHHLEQAIWDPELQTQAALHPGLTEDQRQKLIGAQETPEGLRGQLLAKSVGYLTYPKLGQPSVYSQPMIREPDQHADWLHAHGARDLRSLTASGAVSYNRLKNKPLDDSKRQFSASVSAKTSSLPASVAHETQHSVFARLRQKFGNDVGQKVVSQTLQALDQQDLNHLKKLTDWKIKNRYDPVKEPEERIAYLQNYLQDGIWRKSAHKAMRIHMDRNAEKVAHDWAKQIWMKLRNRAEALGPEHVGVIRKDEEHIAEWLSKQSGDIDYNVSEDMLGLTNRTEQHLEVAKFLGSKEPDRAIFRRALLEDCDLVEAALISVGVQVNAANRKAFRAVMAIQDYPLSKADKTHEVQALMPDGVEVADGVRRGLANNTQEELHLGGKHSAGSMMVRDPETSQMYLVKPGSGPQSPAAGAKEEHASQSRREAAFWHVAEAWGLSQRLPRADLLLIDGAEVAVLHMLPFDWKNLEKLKFKDAGLPHKALEKYRQNGELHKWAILDYVLGNPDRHGQNLMVGPQKEGYPVALIDHGSAFAGPDFDPATDRNSFIPYYLRAWKAEGWGELDMDQKLRSMPAVSGDTELQLRDWFHGINASDLEAVMFRYGLDPAPALARLAKIKALLDQPNLSEAVNRIWLMT